MTTEPIVLVPDDPKARARIAYALSVLSAVARSGSFATRSSTTQRVSLTATHGGRAHEVVVRNGGIGAPSDGEGMNVIHRIDGRRSATIADMSVAPDRAGRLRSRRTMHDHRPRMERWSSLFGIGVRGDAAMPDAATAALDFCQAHIAASMETSGCRSPKTVNLRLAAGDMPLLIRIASIEIHLDMRFVVDDHPMMSRELERRLAPTMPEGWSFASPSKGDVVIAPLHVGRRMVHPAGAIEALRILGSPTHLGMITNFD